MGRGRGREYERAFYGAQYALMAPLFERYGVQLWLPEAGGLMDGAEGVTDGGGHGFSWQAAGQGVESLAGGKGGEDAVEFHLDAVTLVAAHCFPAWSGCWCSLVSANCSSSPRSTVPGR
jgi:hypothetical protein